MCALAALPPFSATAQEAPKPDPKSPNGFSAAAVPKAVVGAVGMQAAAVPGAMAALLAEKDAPLYRTPAQLWGSGQLNGALLAAVLNEPDWGKAERRETAMELSALLVNKAPDQIADPLALPPRTRLRLAEYFKDIRDPRTVTFYEAILSLIKEPREAGVMEVFKLSDYYADIGDLKKAAETRLRMKDYTTAAPYLANSEVEAARFYRQIGEEGKAQKLYEGASRHGYGWATGLSLYDQGIALISQGRYKEAQEILSRPVSGQYSEQIQIALSSQLGYLYYLERDWEKARKYSSEAIRSYESLASVLRGENLEARNADSENILQWIERWETEPFYVIPRTIYIHANWHQDTVRRRVSIRSFAEIPLDTLVSDESVRVSLTDDWQKVDEYSFENYIVIDIAPEHLERKFTVNITINSSKFPNFHLNIPMRVDVEDPIQLSAKTIFFGYVEPKKYYTQNLTLSSVVPFHIININTDNNAIETLIDKNNTTSQKIEFKLFSSFSSGSLVEGVMHIRTDLKGQQIIKIPYSFYVE